MIPPLEEVLEVHARFARARRIDPQRSEPLIAEALRLAADLSDGRPEDEPAAMLFALSRRWSALGPAWEYLPLVYARNLAVAALHARVAAEADDWELTKLQLRIVSGKAEFDEVRSWLAARMRPL